MADDNHQTQLSDQNLTVFSDLTEHIPAPTSLTEHEEASTLSSLYNKFRATVGGGKPAESGIKSDEVESMMVRPPQASIASTTDRISHAQSPKMTTSEVGTKTELPTLRYIPKSTKLSLPSPGLRSPNANNTPSNLANPALSEVTIHAAVNARTHSRAGSSQAGDEPSVTDRHTLTATDEQNLRKVLTRIDSESRTQSTKQNKQTSTLLPIDTKVSSHSRGSSDMTRQLSKPRDASKILHTSSSASRNNLLSEAVVAEDSAPAPDRAPVHVLDLLANLEPSQQAASHVNKTSTSTNLSPNSASRGKRRLSNSRLPGYQASRASSMDSMGTSKTLSTGKVAQVSQGDAQREDAPYSQSWRGSNRLRSRLLAKEFWMKDENAKDCFRCGEIFTTFRRKHHCRTCGQIFDNKCTSLVSGLYFNLAGAVRVCKPCEAIIASHGEDSSEYSDDATEFSARPRTPDHRTARYDDDNVSIVSQSLEHISRTPVMHYPVRRAFDKSNQSAATLEFDAPYRILHRPSSSRSLKHAHGYNHGHKRHYSKHSHMRALRAHPADKVPFQSSGGDDDRILKNSAFHRDSIIDPELAQYLSDDASSDDEPVLQPSASSEKLSKSAPDSDRTTIRGILAAMRKGRTKLGDRSIAGLLNFGGRDADDAASLISARAIDRPRLSRRRNLSIASSIHTKATPRVTRERLQLVTRTSFENETPVSPAFNPSQMVRSASMHGQSAPKLELNRASVQHAHKMLRQLLRQEGVQMVSAWEDALMPILLRAIDDVDPDVRAGDDLDVRRYVKLKKILGGRPLDTTYTSGYIFSKNIALKGMRRSIIRPRVLIITFPIEYARGEAQFMSLDPAIRQEREYLRNLVLRIAALKPDVLLAQKNISGLALELLAKANITVIYNVKPPVLEAVSRCLYADQYGSIDKLALATEQLGTCELFEVRTFVAEGRRKTYVYFSGCPPRLGCTIALRGTDRKELCKIKQIAEFMIYVVYNLKLETCLMRDEWALLPAEDIVHGSYGEMQARNRHVQPYGAYNSNEPYQTQSRPQSRIGENSEPHNDQTPVATDDDVDVPVDVPTSDKYLNLSKQYAETTLSSSPFVRFPAPYLLIKAMELERRVAWYQQLCNKDLSDSVSVEDKSKQKFTLIVPEMIHKPLEAASRKVKEIVNAVHQAEYEKAKDHLEAQEKIWKLYAVNNRNLFEPKAHQKIAVLVSTVSTMTHVPCLGPEVLAFNYYDDREADPNSAFEPDCTLGQYIEDLCYRADELCPALESCGKRLHEHQRQYVHGEAQITLFVESHPPKLRGLHEAILMWSTCKICGVETTVTPMSENTWKYSFAKYLELSFCSADLRARAGICEHDLHRDHLRYFGFRGFAVRVHYDSIQLLDVIVPRMLITWKVDNDVRFRNGVFTRLEHRITRFMVSVKLRLKSINVDALLPESVDACRDDVERLTHQANEDHTMLIKSLQEQYTNSRHWEVIPLNAAVRLLQQKVSDWDDAFALFEKNYFPSEKDIRRLATLQLKKIFLDRDVSVTSLTTGEEAPSLSDTEGGIHEKSTDGLNITRKLSPEKTHDVLQSVMEQHSEIDAKSDTVAFVEEEKTESALQSTVDGALKPRGDAGRVSLSLEHLDLAVPESTTIAPDTTISTENNKMAELPDIPTSITKQPTTVAEHEQSTLQCLQPAVERDITNSTEGHTVTEQTPSTSPNLSRRGTVSRADAPALTRAQSQPSSTLPVRKEIAIPKMSTMSALQAFNGFGSTNDRNLPPSPHETTDKKFQDRFGLGQLKNHRSLIPRAVQTKRDSRVSNLAKHFEQLTREFEQARLRERRLKASRSRRSQIYPTFAPKPTIEVYRNLDEAVGEPDDSDEVVVVSGNGPVKEDASTAEAMVEANMDTTRDGDGKRQNIPKMRDSQRSDDEISVTEDKTDDQHEDEDDDDDDDDVDDDIDGAGDILLPDSPEDLLRLSQEDAEFKDLPKHERSSLMKLLTNFWAERSSSGWASLEYPILPSDHIFQDCDIIVREDELSSIIAFALNAPEYEEQLSKARAETASLPSDPAEQHLPLQERLLNHKESNRHFKFGFNEKEARMVCKVFFAEKFDIMRRACGVQDRFIESLSRCMKFDSRGGKSKALFLKTLDGRFVLKSLSPTETQSFLKFGPTYFKMVSEAFFHEMPSVIAKMLGFYQVIVRNPVTNVEHNWFLLVMENLFYDRVPTRIFDLKGSMRNRKVNATGERNEVLLDENMVDYIYESPLFVREHSKRMLKNSVYNDTLFLAKMSVMDYSLMVAIDETRKELVIGIIDCIRTYTWDKKLESWIKDRGFIGAVASGLAGGAVSGQKNRPTVTSPKEYKRRFREAMVRYVLEAPDSWTQHRTREEEEADRRVTRHVSQNKMQDDRKQDLQHGPENIMLRDGFKHEGSAMVES